MKIVIWYELGIKDTIREFGFSDQTLHLACGMLIVVLGMTALRRPLSATYCVLLALVVAGGNELMDAAFFGSARWADTLADVLYTIALPLLVLAGAILRALAWPRIRATMAPNRRSVSRDHGLLTSDAAD